MAVALTSTVNLVFGAQVLDSVTGIMLNDEMDDFSTPGVPNSFGLWPSPCEISPPVALFWSDVRIQSTIQNPENVRSRPQHPQ